MGFRERQREAAAATQFCGFLMARTIVARQKMPYRLAGAASIAQALAAPH
jgi:hypothetical protein